MKIISNFKDYYDYLQGIYGQDEKIVYERIVATKNNGYKRDDKWVKQGHKPDHSVLTNDYYFYRLAICGLLYCVYYYNKKFYFFSKSEQSSRGYLTGGYYIRRIMGQKNLTPNEKLIKELFSKMGTSKREFITDNRDKFADDLYYIQDHLTETNINEKENCPVILLNATARYRSEGTAGVKNVKLSDYGIPQIVSPNDMYITISGFLSREKKIVDKRTDIEKLTSKGFDKKTSFRKM